MVTVTMREPSRWPHDIAPASSVNEMMVCRGCPEQAGAEKVCASNDQFSETFLSSIRVAVIVNGATSRTPKFSQSDLIDLYEGRPVGGW